MTRVSVAIATYDGRELLDRMLPSVLAQDIDEEVELVVVDDGSRDGTAEHLAQHWPSVRVVTQANAGVTAAMNRCVAETRGEYVAVLNNDLELAPSFLRELVAALDAHAGAGSACGKMLGYGDRTVLDGAGDGVFRSGAAFRRGQGEPDTGQYDEPQEVLSACGGAAMYRRTALDDVGFFDQDFVAYLEDVDWGLRAQLRGWACRYVPAAVCYHVGAATTDRPELSRRFALLQRRNSLLLLVKDFPAAVLLARAPWILAFQLRYLLGSFRIGLGGVHLAAWREALRALPSALRKRRSIQRSRRVPPVAIDRLLTPGINVRY